MVFIYKVDSGKVDGERLCITGRSAGGYTTLASLAFRQTFKAGSSWYGVSGQYCIYIKSICSENNLTRVSIILNIF